MNKVKIDTEKCKGCTYCVMCCPKKILQMSNDLNKKGYIYAKVIDEKECIGCGNCYKFCPEAAIKVIKE